MKLSLLKDFMSLGFQVLRLLVIVLGIGYVILSWF
jgi:hypothetical protein